MDFYNKNPRVDSVRTENDCSTLNVPIVSCARRSGTPPQACSLRLPGTNFVAPGIAVACVATESIQSAKVDATESNNDVDGH